MHSTIRLLQSAAVHTPRLRPFSPTGITGILTHPRPRPALLGVYNTTLKTLATFPEDSVYRTSTEALVNHRKSVVESQIPQGWEAYCEDLKRRRLPSPPTYSDGVEVKRLEGRQIVAHLARWEGTYKYEREFGELYQIYEDEYDKNLKEAWEEENKMEAPDLEGLEDEPDISQEQVEAIEAKIGGGLLEEILIQAYEELKLAKIMAITKPWEPLMEEPVEGQWTYFERKNQ